MAGRHGNPGIRTETVPVPVPVPDGSGLALPGLGRIL
jgi:hypothetical protein